VPHSPEYVLRDHVPVFVPEFEHPEDLVPAEGEAPTSLLPPGFLSPRIRPQSPRALEAEMNVIGSSLYRSLHLLRTPPWLPISTPSISRRARIPEAYTPPRNSDESGVTYTDISSPFEELSDIGSPRVDDHEHFELPEMLEDPYVEVALRAPPSPDYIHSPEEPEQAPPSPDYVPGPEHADDEIVTEDQPYVEEASPTTQSPEYVPESDLEAHPEDDDDEDPEEDPVD
nr:hypothetical protein [Tanacetum cinerariifolium]